MKRDTIREKAREERSTKRAFTAAKLRQLAATFFCASKIALTQCKIRKKAINTYYQIYTLKDNLMFRQVCCWEQPAPDGL